MGLAYYLWLILRVILQVILMSILNLSNNDVTMKIIIGFVIDHYWISIKW
jgi:hypothetical protein